MQKLKSTNAIPCVSITRKGQHFFRPGKINKNIQKNTLLMRIAA